MKTEIWKDIKGFEGLYQVSNLGRVKSLPRIKKGKKNSQYVTKEKILKLKKDKDGYLAVILTSNIRKDCRVNRIVAETFIPNPNNKTIVHHVDENVKNNNADNLQWVTNKENLYASNVFEKLSKKYSKPIIQKDLKGNILNKFNSTQEASKALGLDARNISAVTNGKRNQIKGYIFEKVVCTND